MSISDPKFYDSIDLSWVDNHWRKKNVPIIFVVLNFLWLLDKIKKNMLPNKIYFKKMIEIIDNLATMSIYTIKSHFKKQYGFFIWPPFILFIYFKRIFVTNLSVKISVIFLVKIYARVQNFLTVGTSYRLHADCTHSYLKHLFHKNIFVE